MKINLRGILPPGHSNGYGLHLLKISRNDEFAGASRTEGLFSVQWDTKREEAFNTNTTLCTT